MFQNVFATHLGSSSFIPKANHIYHSASQSKLHREERRVFITHVKLTDETVTYGSVLEVLGHGSFPEKISKFM